MRIGLISDTHIPGGAMEIPQMVERAFEGVDLILHAGNVYTPATLDWLERIAPVKAAVSVGRDQGCMGDPRVADKQVLQLEGHTIGMIHDLIMPAYGDVHPGIIEAHRGPGQDMSQLAKEYFGTAVDIFIFGHTCVALAEEHQGVLFINPGSPTLRNQLRKIGNVAVMDLTKGERVVESIDLAGLI